MQATHTTFSEIDVEKFGIVIVGAAVTEGNDTKWIEGITESLCENGVLPEGTKPEAVWESAVYTTSTGGRHDLVLYAKDAEGFAIGIMALWRLSFAGQVSWIDDWKVNYADHYGYIGVPRMLEDFDD
jgi:hypothetical protein